MLVLHLLVLDFLSCFPYNNFLDYMLLRNVSNRPSNIVPQNLLHIFVFVKLKRVLEVQILEHVPTYIAFKNAVFEEVVDDVCDGLVDVVSAHFWKHLLHQLGLLLLVI